MALGVDNSSKEMFGYLRLVTIEKGIREPNVDSWASSFENKLIDIGITSAAHLLSYIPNLSSNLIVTTTRLKLG
jgi:hypothetical protein